jgi:hydrogenase maturation protease
MRTLVLGRGNDLLSDDAVGLLAVRQLQREIPPGGGVEVVETGLAGLALLDHFIGFDRALILDSICTGRRAPGTVTEIAPADLHAIEAPSPHFAGLPELLALARRLELPFPTDIRILAIETADPYTLGGGLSPAVEAGLAGLVARAREILAEAAAPAAGAPCAPPAESGHA